MAHKVLKCSNDWAMKYKMGLVLQKIHFVHNLFKRGIHLHRPLEENYVIWNEIVLCLTNICANKKRWWQKSWVNFQVNVLSRVIVNIVSLWCIHHPKETMLKILKILWNQYCKTYENWKYGLTDFLSSKSKAHSHFQMMITYTVSTILKVAIH